MTKRIVISGATIFLEFTMIKEGHLLIEDGIIAEISKQPITVTDEVDVIDGTGLQVLPGFIDIHIHGANGADVMDATEEALRTMASSLPKEGTTSFLATTMTQSHEQIERALSNVAAYHNKDAEATLLGVHLEGPFIHKAKKGAQPEQYIIPGDVALFNQWQQLADGHIYCSGDRKSTRLNSSHV